jgi:hypothetical protein
MTSKIVRSPLGRCNHPAAGQTKPGPQKNTITLRVRSRTTPGETASELDPTRPGASVSRPPIWGNEPSHRGLPSCSTSPAHRRASSAQGLGRLRSCSPRTIAIPVGRGRRGFCLGAAAYARRAGTHGGTAGVNDERWVAAGLGAWVLLGGHVLVLGGAAAPRPCCGIAAVAPPNEQLGDGRSFRLGARAC